MFNTQSVIQSQQIYYFSFRCKLIALHFITISLIQNCIFTITRLIYQSLYTFLNILSIKFVIYHCYCLLLYLALSDVVRQLSSRVRLSRIPFLTKKSNKNKLVGQPKGKLMKYRPKNKTNSALAEQKMTPLLMKENRSDIFPFVFIMSAFKTYFYVLFDHVSSSLHNN